MSRYRVFGRRYQDYYIIINAKNESNAYNIAMNEPRHKWNKLDIDDEIEPTDVYLDEDISSDELQLNKDNYKLPGIN